MKRRSRGMAVPVTAALAWLIWAATVGWLILSFAAINLGVACPAFSNDNSGGPESEWQWFPPGMSCTYAEVRITPDLSLLLLSLMAVAWPAAWFALALGGRRTGAEAELMTNT